MRPLNELVVQCLEGSQNAYLELDREMRPSLVGSLQNRGASHAVAEEIAADILGECSLPGERSLLRRFKTNRDFKSWLLRVGINRLIDRQRRQVLFQEQEPLKEPAGVSLSPEFSDSALRQIVKSALVESFAACEPQMRVLLWLRFSFDVKQTRLAKAWGWSEAKLSRKLDSSCSEIREGTLRNICRREPGLTLLWDDVLEVCADMQGSLFSV